MPFASVLKQFKKTKRRAKSSNSSSLMDTENTSQLTSSLDVIGRNSMALPIIMRDINVMKQGILKLVKIAGGTQRDKADRFFLSSSDREKSYESQMAAKTSKSPTKTGDKKDGKGFFGQANDFLNAIIAGGLTNMLIKGGLIAGILYGIGKFFTSAEFRNGIFDMIGKFGRTVFGEEGWKDVKKNIMYGSAILLAGIIAIKTSINLVVAGLAFLAKKLFGFGGVSSTGGGIRGKKGAGGVGKVFRGLGVAGIGLGLYNMFSGGDDEESSGLGGAAVAATGLAVGSSMGGYSTPTPKTAPSTPKEQYRDPKTGRYAKAPTSRWTRFLAFLERKAPKLYAKIGLRLLSAGAGLAVPGPGWIWTAINILGSAVLAWELYGWWKEFTGEDEKQSNSPTKEETQTEKQSKNMSLEEMMSGAGIDLKINNTPNYYGMPGASSPTSTSPSGSNGFNATGAHMDLPKGKSISTKAAVDYLVSKGLSPAQAAGVVGNLVQESTLNSGAHNKPEGAYGLAQWRGSRLQDLAQFASSRGKEISDVNTQLDFIMHEMSNKESKAGAMLRSSNTAEEAAFNFGKYYERPKTVEQSRMAYANSALKEYGNGSATVAASDGSSKSTFQGTKSVFEGIVSPFAKTGAQINQGSQQINNSRNAGSSAPINIDARTSNSTTGGGGQISLPASGVIDTELAKLLVERAIG
jgi:hypothetical protein